MKDCLFCKIVSGELPASVVYRDEYVLAFLDINPANHGHILLIPRDHSQTFNDTPDNVLQHLVVVAKHLAIATQKTLGAHGSNIVVNTNKEAGQVVFHTHLHIIPRFSGDGHKGWKQTPYHSDKEREEVAEKIRSSL